MQMAQSTWRCASCTFDNHRGLVVCEMCEKPRASEVVDLCTPPGTPVANATSSELPNPGKRLASSSVSQPLRTNHLVGLFSRAAALEGLSYRFPHFPPEHYTQAGGYGARWSCGYRNIQMLCSSLMQLEEYRQVLFDGSGRIPTIPELQACIEKAWGAGFDIEGAQQLDFKLRGTNKWIGTTECAALLRYFRVRAIIVDFPSYSAAQNSPSVSRNASVVESLVEVDQDGLPLSEQPDRSPGTNLSHSSQSEGKDKKRKRKDSARAASTQTAGAKSKIVAEVADRVGQWMQNYFDRSDPPPVAPVYFQHHGHSFTVAGIARNSSDNSDALPQLIVFDPSCSTQALLRTLDEATQRPASPPTPRKGKSWRSSLLKSLHSLKERDYQALCVAPGLLIDEREYNQAKILNSMLA